MINFIPNVGLSGILTPEDFDSFIVQVADGNHGIRNVAIFYLSHYANVKSRNLVKLNMGDLETSLSGIYNNDLKAALYNYIIFRKDNDGLVYNVAAPAFASQKGLRFSADTLRRMVRNVYKSTGYQDCSYSSGQKSELWVAYDRLVFEALIP